MYYVYAYLREDGSPYYIGKGTKDRAWKKAKHERINKPPIARIVIMENGLTELGALALERRYIKWYGRKNNNTGILRNATDGGEGVSGVVYSKETIQKRIAARIGRKWFNNGVNEVFAHEAPKDFTEGRIGYERTDRHRKNIANSLNTPVKIDGIVFESKQAAAKHFNKAPATITHWLKKGRATEWVNQPQELNLKKLVNDI